MEKPNKTPEQLAIEINELSFKLNKLIHEGLLSDKLLIVEGHGSRGARTEYELLADTQICPYYIRVQAALKI